MITVRVSALRAVPDIHHVAVLDNVLLALQPQCTLGARARFGSGVEKLVPVDRLGADEVLLEIRVDRTRRLLRASAARHGPGAAFVFADGEEGDQPQKFVSLANEACQSALVQPVAGEELGRLFVTHLRELGLHLPADGGRARVGKRSNFGEVVPGSRGVQIPAQLGALADVDHVQDRLLAEESEAAQALLVVGVELELAHEPSAFELRLALSVVRPADLPPGLPGAGIWTLNLASD